MPIQTTKDYEKELYRFGLGGMQLSRSQELLEEHKIAIGRNIRSYITGSVQPRKGIGTALFSQALASTNVHSLRRFNDPTTGNHFFILGAGSSIFTAEEGNNPSSALESGFSGNPLQMAFLRPFRSAYNWAYISDANKMRKISPSKSLQNWSITPVNQPVDVILGTLNFKAIDIFDTIGAWAQGGTAGAPSILNYRINFTIPASPVGIKYDSGSTGWASIIPSAMDENFQPGACLTYNPGGGTEEKALIFSVSKASGSSAVKAIRYDSGSTGRCIIQLETPYTSVLQKDAVVKLTVSGNSEYCRVLEVIPSAVNKPAIIVSTTLTHTTSSTCEAVRSYRTYLKNTHATGETVRTSYISFSVTSGTGYISTASVLDLTTSDTPATASFTDNDTIHISLRISDPSKITEVIVKLDCNSATNDFTQNYFQYAIQPAALTTASTSLTAAQIDLQRDSITNSTEIIGYKVPDNYSPYYNYDYSYGSDGNNYYPGSPGQVDYNLRSPTGAYQEPVYGTVTSSNPTGVSDATTGASQWTELVIKLRDFKRIGSDLSRSWKDIAALRIDVIATDTVTVDADSWYIGGTGQLSTMGIGLDLNYMVIPRNALTGDEGLPCPPLRSSLKVNRATSTLTIYQSTDSQVTDYDVYRIGGLLQKFTYIGSVPHKNASSTTTFYDNFADEDVIGRRELAYNYPVFPQLDIKREGEATVVGNYLSRTSGDNFNTSWAAGSRITITDETTGQSFDTGLYASPYSTSALELQESLPFAASTTLKWKISEPVLLGQPVTSIFGPYTSGLSLPIIFGVGSMYQAGTLFWTNPGMPGAAAVTNQLEITSPQEPLIGGFIYDSQAFVMSTERLFHVRPTGDTDTPFVANEVANSKGLISASCVSVGQVVSFVGKDGIYITTGGQPRSITDRDLYTLFPHDSQSGSLCGPSLNIYPPDLDESSRFYLTHHQDTFYFSYLNTNGDRRHLVFDVSKIISGFATDDDVGGWISFDDYSPVMNFPYSEEGVINPRLLMAGNDGKVYALDSNLDNGVGFPWEVESRAFPFGDAKSLKWVPSIDIKANTGGLNVTVKVRTNNSTSLTTLGTISNTTDTFAEISTSTTEGGISCESLAVNLSGTSSNSATPFIYGLAIDHTIEGESTSVKWSAYDNVGDNGSKWFQGIRIDADTGGTNKQYTIIYDDEQIGPTITINHSSRSIKTYTFTPFIANQVRLKPIGAGEVNMYTSEWVSEPEPDLALNWVPQPTTFDFPGWFHLRACYIALRSTSTVTLTITADIGESSPRIYTYTIPSTLGEYKKVYIPLHAIKGKNVQPKLTSTTGFRVYYRDVEMHAKPWGSNDAYSIMKPFGGPSKQNGAIV